jgi:hypothetical protein
MLSPDARVALHPEPTYRQLITEAPPPAWRVLVRPALVLLVIAVGLPTAAVHQVTLRLVLTTAIAWSVVVVIQAAIGAAVIAWPSRRRIGFVHALDLWFVGHLPYSVLILALPFVTAVPLATPHELMGAAAVVPVVWTAIIVSAFCREVLGLTPTAARWRASAHLALVLIVGGALIVWAAGGPTAILSYAVRRLSGVWF